MSETKNGIPTSEVTTPIGKMVPWISILETMELADNSNAPHNAAAGMKKR